MDFGVSTVFSIIGKAISLGKAIWHTIQSMKELEESRQNMQRQISVLMNILTSIENDDSLRNPKVYREVYEALINLSSILEEAFEMCASFQVDEAIKALTSFKDKKILEKILDKAKQAKEVAGFALTAEGKMKALYQVDQRLKLALSIVQTAFSYTQVKQLQHLESQMTAELQRLHFVDGTVEVYGNPNGVPPKCVQSVKAEVSKERLIVSWKAGEDEDEHRASKYEVRYLENTYLHITSTETSVAIGSQRIKPWQNYAIQVRAVNDVGASSWSFPPIDI